MLHSELYMPFNICNNTQFYWQLYNRFLALHSASLGSKFLDRACLMMLPTGSVILVPVIKHTYILKHPLFISISYWFSNLQNVDLPAEQNRVKYNFFKLWIDNKGKFSKEKNRIDAIKETLFRHLDLSQTLKNWKNMPKKRGRKYFSKF